MRYPLRWVDVSLQGLEGWRRPGMKNLLVEIKILTAVKTVDNQALTPPRVTEREKERKKETCSSLDICFS